MTLVQSQLRPQPMLRREERQYTIVLRVRVYQVADAGVAEILSLS